MATSITINRAPVLTLWASVVAERLGFDRPEALSLGRAVAGLNAQSKGRRLGVFKPHEREPKEARERDRGDEFLVEVCGRAVPAVVTPDGEVRAVSRGKPVSPGRVESYLAGKFGDRLKAARAAMVRLAKALGPEELAARAYPLYEQFRPEIPEGTKGWGAKGELDLDRIKRLAGRGKPAGAKRAKARAGAVLDEPGA
jgi:hypothetical protein